MRGPHGGVVTGPDPIVLRREVWILALLCPPLGTLITINNPKTLHVTLYDRGFMGRFGSIVRHGTMGRSDEGMA